MVDRLHDALRDRVRDAAIGTPWPRPAAWTPSRSRAPTRRGGRRGFDAGKKVNGRKRHLVVDTISLLVITSASVQDRGRARTLLDRLTMAMPSLSLLWADGGYAGKLVDWANQVAHITAEIVRKPLGINMFQVLPRRRVVERTFAWIVKCRRLDHDYEATAADQRGHD